jgi:hypothetical protein
MKTELAVLAQAPSRIRRFCLARSQALAAQDNFTPSSLHVSERSYARIRSDLQAVFRVNAPCAETAANLLPLVRNQAEV